MEISSSIDSLSVEKQIKKLTKEGKFKDALLFGEQHWGQYKNWHRNEQIDSLIPLLNRLGLGRSGDYLRYRRWRQNPQNSQYALSACHSVFSMKGPYYLWKQADSFLADSSLDNENKADWLLLKCQICSTLKDHEEAGNYYQQAKELFPSKWLDRFKGYLLVDQEEYLSARNHLQNLYNKYPSEPLLQQLFRVMCLTDTDYTERLELLEKESAKYQSINPLMLLAYEYHKLGRWDNLKEILDHVNHLKIGQDKQLAKSQNYLYAYLSLSKGDTKQAAIHFNQSGGHYCETLANNIISSSNKEKRILDVPFLKQKSMTCAPASMSALLNYHGIDKSQAGIAKKICYNGTPDYLQKRWLDQQNIPYREFDFTWNLTKQLINNDLPFTLVTRSGSGSHMQVIKGYNELTGTVHLMDPSNADVSEMLAKELVERNASVGPRCMVFLPQGKESKIADLAFQSEEVYKLSAKFDQHLRRHNLKDAEERLKQLNTIYPEERLTLEANRSWSQYSQGDAELKKANYQLEKMYPDEIWIIRSLYSSLFSSGNRTEGVELLLNKIDKYGYSELVDTLFHEIYDDDKYVQESHHLLKLVHKNALYSGESNWLIGHYFWNQGNYQDAARHFRWAHSLDDKDERFSESFFKAYRWVGRKDEALSLLKKRWQIYNTKSYGPALSLFNALELTDQEHKGLEYIKASVLVHSQEEELVDFYLSKLLKFGNIEEFHSEFKEHSDSISPSRKLAIQADYYVAIDKHEKACDCLLELVKKHPNSRTYYEKLFHIERNLGHEELIEEQLTTLEQNFSNTWNTSWLIINWTQNKDRRLTTLEIFSEKYPDNLPAIIKLSNEYIRNNRLKEAESLVLRILRVRQTSSELYALLSTITLLQKDVDLAKKQAYQALECNVDCDEAFDALIRSHIGAGERRKALLNMIEIIKKSVSHGDAMWNLWHSAKAWFSTDELTKLCVDNLSQRPDLWYSWILMAKQHVTCNSLTKAEKILTQAVKKFPLIPRVHLEQAELYLLMQQTNESINAFRETLKLNPSWTFASRRLSSILDNAGEFDKSLSVLNKAVRYHNQDGILFGLIADLNYKLGDKESALVNLEKAVGLEIDYPWAWVRLKDWGKLMGREALEIKIANRLVEKHPESPLAWLSLARVETDSSLKEQHFKKGITFDSRNIELHQELINFYIERRNYKSAKTQINHPCWAGQVPVTIKVLNCDILTSQSRYGEAIDSLAELLQIHEEYSNGWEKMHSWSISFNFKERALEAAIKLIKINPHDAAILSYCSDTLLNHGSSKDKKIAFELVERAFSIDPQDLYTALSWLDLLLDSKRFSEAEEVEIIASKFIDNPLLDLRIMSRLCSQTKTQKALELWPKLVEKNVDNRWIYDQGYNLFKKKKDLNYIETLLKETITDDKTCEAICLKWAQIKCNEKYGIKKILDVLEKELPKENWEAICYQYIQYLCDNNMVPKKQFVEKFRTRLLNNVELFGNYGFLLLRLNKYDDGLDWYSNHRFDSDTPAYIFYHYQWMMMESNNWSEAGNIVYRALDCEPDNTYSNICLWVAFHKTVNNGTCFEKDLVNISWDELTDIEKYVYCLLNAIRVKDNKPLAICREEVSPLLREAQQYFPPVADFKIAKSVQKSIRKLLSEQLSDEDFFKRLSLKFWLMNRF